MSDDLNEPRSPDDLHPPAGHESPEGLERPEGIDPADATPQATHQAEAYLDIVWKQFKKNRAAYLSLWTLAPLFLLALFAPAIASNQPLVFYDGEETIYPWIRSLFNTAQSSDFVFNLAMLAFIPWGIGALIANHLMKRRHVPGRRRLGWVSLVYLLMICLLVAIFSFQAMRPKNRYEARAFSEEEFRSNGKAHGVYVLIPLGPTEQDLDARHSPPLYRKPKDQWKEANDGYTHWFGTGDIGQDVLVQMLYGARISMSVGFVAVGLYVTIGVIVGAIAGYFGGWVDMLISRMIEIVMLFPTFFLILTLVAMIGPSIYVIMFVIGITGWPSIARLIRGEVLKQRSIDYTAAARALGASHFRVIFVHILPNAISPALVAAPFGVAGAIIVESTLSLLGFGVRPPTPSWGTLLRMGNANYAYWWLIVIPSVAIFLTVTVFNLVGSGLRDAMDPRLRV